MFLLLPNQNPSPLFKYKQFTIRDENSAMKVGTDGTLLGCWVDVSKAKTILDIGAGTGVIGIMCAQKNQKAEITSLEIDDNAVVDAGFNISSLLESWNSRINLIHKGLENFESKVAYDVIVSNPPFFEKSQENIDDARTKARHTSSLHYTQIFEFSQKHLSESGELSMILPFENGQEAIQVCSEYKLSPVRVCEVKPVPQKAPHRLLLTFAKEERNIEKTFLTIETGVKRHEYSADYIKLGKEFYLYF